MAKPFYIDSLLEEEELACYISEQYQSWENMRQERVDLWKEVQQYIFATDTTFTSNAKLPWSNKTTIPKLSQIRENLHANYMAALFPKKTWLHWEGASAEDEQIEKKETIQTYMNWVVDREDYYKTVSRLIYDYIDYGNAFVMPVWQDNSATTATADKVGYVGPAIKRISPLDIAFNPTADSFINTPKIIRSFVTIPELKELLHQSSATPEEKEAADAIIKYLRDTRDEVHEAAQSHRNVDVRNDIYRVNGFNSFVDYLDCGSVELLTFYGDLWEEETDTILKNYIVQVVDRHKVVYKAPNASAFGYPPIFHAGWKIVQDNLWGRGPLDNLVGMQYRIDHLENMKADCFDLIAYPPLKIKGSNVEPFEWGPMERIYMDLDSDVEMMSPNTQTLQADNQIAILERKMEEMAGAPREALGFRTPGEKTKYEVQSIENAASRMFQSKIAFFEIHITEPSINGMLELARRNLNPTTIRIIDDEFKFATFKNLSKYDITGIGRLKPLAARHFAEKANMVQNLTAFFNSAIGQDPMISQHFSSEKLARMIENLLEIEEYNIVEPYVRLSEQAQSQRLSNTHNEQVAMEQQTASGLNGDFDLDPNSLPTTGV